MSESGGPSDLSWVREDFPALSQGTTPGAPLIYLDNAATTQRPRQILETLQTVYTRYNANVHRSSHRLGEAATGLFEDARESTARFIGAASSREVVFTRNTTEALNLLATAFTRRDSAALRLLEGDEVLITVMEHHSNLVPWQSLCAEVGAVLRVLDVGPDGRLDVDVLESMLGPCTRLVCCSHVSNVLGTINPVREIARRSHAAGALVVVDGAQSVPGVPVDVRQLECDFLAFSGHKMLAPFGIGVLYGREQLLERLAPFLYGGDMIETVSVTRSTWNVLPWKFEAGTPDVASAVAFGGATDRRTGKRLVGAIDYLANVGMNRIRDHEVTLLRRLMGGISSVSGATIYGPVDPHERAAVISFSIEGTDPFVIARLLDERGICVRAGGHCAHPLAARLGVEGTIRVSPYLYNTPDEIDRFLDALGSVVRLARP